ncbi:MAG: hypothetical protein LBC94_07920 [Desulfovibrio sp.]|jgi:hypothetical protein|nr:hypothetical protein [Desulfovibrio sp.]
MKEEYFKYFLEDKGLTQRAISDYISRCRRIENKKSGLGVNLDNEYARDKGKSLLNLLTYTRGDQNLNIKPPIIFQKNSDIYNGMRSIKSAATSYFKFCSESISETK